MNPVMEHPFSKSTTTTEKCKRLLDAVHADDRLGIVINADPDAISSAWALKRFFWRKVRSVKLFHINPIERADNLAMVRLLKIDLKLTRSLRKRNITKWAIVDSQPQHHELFRNHNFDIIIDHHPVQATSKAFFVDIREEYGANATILTEYLRNCKIKPSAKLATALFYGIKTDTANFVREAQQNDINAFRYLYSFVNINTIKKIESSEITKETLCNYALAMNRLQLIGNIALVNMGEVANPDILVIIADFFMKLVDVEWSVVTGIRRDKLIVILRNAGFRGNAGKMAQKLFGPWGASAGGHKTAARAEVPMANIVGVKSEGDVLARAILKDLRQYMAEKGNFEEMSKKQ